MQQRGKNRFIFPQVGLSRLSASGTMPEHFSKWKLNKAEQKSVEEEEKRVYAERKTAGDSDEDAQKAASEAAATKSKELSTPNHDVF